MPLCTERKILLSGGVQTYACELLHYTPGFGVLRYVLDREYVVGGIHLRPNDITHALYWEDRPYTLYLWHLTRARKTVSYFNIADSISLTPREFVWRDLAVDVLADQTGRVVVLDEDELPADLDQAMVAYIAEAKTHILNNNSTLIGEAKDLLQSLGLAF